jgi:hypothetical protein
MEIREIFDPSPPPFSSQHHTIFDLISNIAKIPSKASQFASLIELISPEASSNPHMPSSLMPCSHFRKNLNLMGTFQSERISNAFAFQEIY